MRSGRTAAALILLLGACDEPPVETPDAGPKVTSTVGPQGGLVQGEGITLSVPEGALADEVSFRIVVSDVGAPEVTDRVRISKVFQILPEKTKFALPATVTLTYLPERIPDGVPADSADVRRTDFTRAQERLNSVIVNTVATTVAGETHSLGTFWSTVPAGPRPATIKVTPEFQVVFQGQKVKYTAEVRDQNDRLMPGQAVVWSVTDKTVATIAADGEATAIGPGSTDVIARAGSAQGKAELLVASTAPFPSQFSWENPVPQGNTLFGVKGDAAAVCVSGDNGTVLCRGAAASWTRLYSVPVTSFNDVALRTSEVIAVGTRGDKGILLRLDGKKKTATEQLFLDAQPSAVYADANLGMAVGEGSQVLLMDPANGNWSSMPSPTTESLLAVDGSTGALIVVGSRGAVYTLVKGAWVALSTAPLPQIQKRAVLRGSEAFSVSDKVLRKFAGGAWTTETLPATIALTFTAMGLAADVLLLAGFDANGKVSIVSNDGRNGYKLHALPGPEKILGLWGRSAAEMFAVGEKGALYRWSGQQFVLEREGSVGEVVKLVAFAPDRLFAAANECLTPDCKLRTGAVLDRKATGAFASTGGGFGGELNALGGRSVNDLWAAGAGGRAYHYNGASWTQSSVAGAVYDIRACGGTTYATGDGKVFADAGGTLATLVDFGQAVPLRGIACTATGMFIVGDGAVVQVTGATAKVLDPQQDRIAPAVFRAVWATPEGQAFIGGDARYVLHWNGSKFKAHDRPANLPLASVRGIYGTSIGDVYVVGTLQGGGGFALHFNGAFWQVLDAGTSGAVNAVAGLKPGELWIGGESGAVLFGKAVPRAP
jgi:hypothetical protein